MIELNKIYNEDCLIGMQRIPDKSVDLVITDPPYLMNYRSNRRISLDKFDHIKNDKNSHDLISSFLVECYRILKDNTAIYMFCSWHHIDFFKREFERHFKLKNIIVWNKDNHGSGDLKGSYAPKHEFILFGHKGRCLLKNKRIPDVIDCAKIPSMRLTHPTEKPTPLIDIFVKNSSTEGDLIVDGFVGTGSILESAILNDRNFIGFEMDKGYFDIANERIEDLQIYL